jgi:hypothetical protein
MKPNQTTFLSLVVHLSLLWYSQILNKIILRALCGITLRVFENYNARISHERGTRPACVISVSRPKIGPDACCNVLSTFRLVTRSSVCLTFFSHIMAKNIRYVIFVCLFSHIVHVVEVVTVAACFLLFSSALSSLWIRPLCLIVPVWPCVDSCLFVFFVFVFHFDHNIEHCMVYDPDPFLWHVRTNLFSNPRHSDDSLNAELPSSARTVLVTALCAASCCP